MRQQHLPYVTVHAGKLKWKNSPGLGLPQYSADKALSLWPAARHWAIPVSMAVLCRACAPPLRVLSMYDSKADVSARSPTLFVREGLLGKLSGHLTVTPPLSFT